MIWLSGSFLKATNKKSQKYEKRTLEIFFTVSKKLPHIVIDPKPWYFPVSVPEIWLCGSLNGPISVFQIWRKLWFHIGQKAGYTKSSTYSELGDEYGYILEHSTNLYPKTCFQNSSKTPKIENSYFRLILAIPKMRISQKFIFSRFLM